MNKEKTIAELESLKEWLKGVTTIKYDDMKNKDNKHILQFYQTIDNSIKIIKE